MRDSFTTDYWDTIIAESTGGGHEDLWRAHLKEVYKGLMDRWGENLCEGSTLKTDLYDEAISDHSLISLCGRECSVIGTEGSFGVAMAAKKRVRNKCGGLRNVVCSDIRSLAFRSDSFDRILSNSTLDHFHHKKDLIAGLKELRRIMKPGGTLIISLDNPSNPIVLVRNFLPYKLLKFFGFIPFYMGVTLSGSKLTRALESIGFTIQANTAIVHSPRILAIWIGYVLDKIANKKIKVHFHRLLNTFERLEKLPLKCFSGYFVAVKAIKR